MKEKIYLKINGNEYKNIFINIVWSGGIHGTSRKLEVEYIKDELIIELGDSVEFYFDERLMFTGRCFFVSKKGDSNTYHFYCFDDSIYLNKNKFIKNFFRKKPSEIFKEICGELNLKVGNLPKDVVNCTYPAIDRSGYEIILNAYRIQFEKTKKIYSIVCNKGIIEVIEQGELIDVLLTSKDGIEGSSFEKSIENMVNQIVIYKTENDKVQIVKKVDNAEDKTKYGLFQNVMEYEKDSDSINNAREMLKSVEKTAKLNCLGNILLQSGYSIGVEEPNTGIVGTFLIKNDTHLFDGSKYHCEIELAFENIMDKTEFKNKKKKNKSEEKDKLDILFPEGWDKK